MNMNEVVGRQVSKVRLATPREMERCGWADLEPPVVFVLENGYIILSAGDADRNAPGQMLLMDILTDEVSAFQGGGQTCPASPPARN